jgi:hypothetical protein
MKISLLILALAALAFLIAAGVQPLPVILP